jgi:membrane protein implicated in regulation of membrane protease activity
MIRKLVCASGEVHRVIGVRHRHGDGAALAPFRSRPTYALGLDPLCVSLLFSLFLVVAVVLSTKRKGQERSPARKVLPRKGTQQEGRRVEAVDVAVDVEKATTRTQRA